MARPLCVYVRLCASRSWRAAWLSASACRVRLRRTYTKAAAPTSTRAPTTDCGRGGKQGGSVHALKTGHLSVPPAHPNQRTTRQSTSELCWRQPLAGQLTTMGTTILTTVLVPDELSGTTILP